jgi:hypothetical protein
MEEINRLTDEKAMPWTSHPVFGDGPELDGAGPGFRAAYEGFGAGL